MCDQLIQAQIATILALIIILFRVTLAYRKEQTRYRALRDEYEGEADKDS